MIGGRIYAVFKEEKSKHNYTIGFKVYMLTIRKFPILTAWKITTGLLKPTLHTPILPANSKIGKNSSEYLWTGHRFLRQFLKTLHCSRFLPAIACKLVDKISVCKAGLRRDCHIKLLRTTSKFITSHWSFEKRSDSIG